MTYHVYPDNDIEPHNTDGSYCPCGLTEENGRNGCHLIIHQSYDGREKMNSYTTNTATEDGAIVSVATIFKVDWKSYE